MPVPVYLNSLNKVEFKQFLDKFDHVFSDCDGVLWTGGTPLPGSGEFVRLMRNLGKTVDFVSNNSLKTLGAYKSLFDRSAIENGVEHLTIPSIAIADYLKSIKFDKHVYCVTCDETIRTFESNGLKCKYGPDFSEPDFLNFLKFLEDDPDVGAVVFDSDLKVNLPKLYRASAYLKRPDVLFICGASDKLLPLKPGISGIGPGAFTDLVKDEVKREPILLGKPGKLFGEFAMGRAGVTDPSRVLFIGDMIEQDVGLGKAVGFQTLLVLTSLSKETMFASNEVPDYYATNLGDLVSQIKELI